jgi:putative ABC transport system permease protein
MLRRVVGDDTRLPFLALASLRSHFMRQPVLTLLTGFVIALSVALVLAVGLSFQSVEQTLSRSADALRGRADLEVTAGAVGMPEDLLGPVSEVPGIAAAAPVIETSVRLSGGPKDGRALRILGVDLLADQSVRSYTVLQRSLHVLDPLLLVAKSDSVIISEILARDLGVSEGDTFRVRLDFGERTLAVRGLLAAGGMADAYAGQLVVMDVYALQALLDRRGSLDRIDLVLTPGAKAADVRAAVAAKILGIATVRQPDPGNQLAGAAIAALRFLAGVIAVVGVLISALLSYAAVAASVDRRTRAFALFRAAGLEAKEIHRLVYFDSLMVGVGGVIVGTPLGLWLSRLFAAVFSQTSAWLSGIEISPAAVSPGVLLIGGGVGIGVSQLSAVLASRRSTRLAPHEAIASGRGLGLVGEGAVGRRAWGSALAALCAWIIVWKAPVPIAGTVRAGALFALGIVLLWTSTGPFLAIVLPLLKAGAERFAPGIGRVAGGSLLMRLNQTRIAVVSIAALIATVSSLWIVAVSMVETFDKATSTNGGAVIRAADSDDWQITPLTRDTVEAVAGTPGVQGVFQHYMSEILYRGETVQINASTPDVLANHRGLELLERIGPDEEVVRALQDGGIIVYEAFQRRFGVKLGDSIELDTPHGEHGFTVVGVRPAYQTGSSGGIQMDLATYDRYWTRPGVSNLVVWTTGLQKDVLDEIQKKVGGTQNLFFMSGADVDRVARNTLGRFSSLIYALLALVALLAGGAVVNLLVGASKDLRADVALLQCLGASHGQLSRLVLVEGLTIGLAGVLSGFMLAGVFAAELGALVTGEFGWAISWRLRPAELCVLGVGTAAVSALIGLAAATRIRRGASWNALAPE